MNERSSQSEGTRSRDKSQCMSDDGRFYLVGGGIASLAAAAFLIRDAKVPGHLISIFEELNKLGGSLDGGGTPDDGYIIRGGRMLESRYSCTYDLFDSIPTTDGRTTVTKEIFSWNANARTHSKSRLVRDGKRQESPAYGLARKHLATIARLAVEPESLLDASRIDDHFDQSFFETNFWVIWATTFAFQPWHSAVEFRRYLLRFAHMTPGLNRLDGIMRTVFNQYDSMVVPLKKWLGERGVNFRHNTKVVDLHFDETDPEARCVSGLACETGGIKSVVPVQRNDVVLVTLGSMTASSSFGTTCRRPKLELHEGSGAWELWKNIAAGRPKFGNPSTFADHVNESKWLSFTATLHDPTFFELIRNLTGNVPGEGGLITFSESNWLASIVLPHQPHFVGQPRDVQVFWGYGLFVDRPGNYVEKAMAECTGREILTEILGHLRVEESAARILDDAICIPCLMPYITSQFLARRRGDRPQIIPEGWANLAFIGQFCEVPDDVVFTVEYSIRSAQAAVYRLLGIDRSPPAIHSGKHDVRGLYRAMEALVKSN
ncbi:Oleate hydratase [Caballeronia pedi]|uniref:Oleate hydratase n=1 Tax=Caballeronia pedi TaxID=1777141 RepID=A0A158A334_9BURK|nr:Oleate hydratase [Caballeronia pedi]